MLCFFSCQEDDEPFSFVPNETEFGAFPRLLSLFSDDFDLDDIPNSVYSHQVDFVTEENGNNVETYEIVVEYVDNNPSNGDNSNEGEVYANLSQEDFCTSSFGNKDVTLNITFLELADVLELDPNSVAPGDEFNFRTSLILNDGRVFNSENSANIILNVPDAYFDWTIGIACPVEDNLFTGLYSITYEVGGNDLIGPAYNNGDIVELVTVDNSNSLREFSTELLPDLPSLVAITRFELFCEMAVFVSADTGIDCNGEETDNSINFGPAIDVFGNPLSEFLDLTDDSEIVLFVNEGADPGNCSLNDTQSRLTLTKM